MFAEKSYVEYDPRTQNASDVAKQAKRPSVAERADQVAETALRLKNRIDSLHGTLLQIAESNEVKQPYRSGLDGKLYDSVEYLETAEKQIAELAQYLIG